MRTPVRTAVWAFLAGAFLAAAPATARADVIYTVTLNTQPLQGQPGPFAIDFQFTDGSGLGDNNNRATVSAFSFGGGSPVPPASPTGDVSGSLEGPPVVLRDSQGFNEFIENFNPGSQFRFTVGLTTRPEANPNQSDSFTFAILQNGANIPTTNPDGSDTFFEVNITSSGPTFIRAGSTVGSGFNIPPPQVVQVTAAVPEPGTLALFLLGGAGGAALRWRRRGARRP